MRSNVQRPTGPFGLILITSLMVGTACRPSKPSQPAQAQEPSAPKEEGVAQLLKEHWQFVLQSDPLFATHLGIHDYDHLLPQRSSKDLEEQRQRRAGFLARAQRLGSEDPQTSVTLSLFREELSTDLAADTCMFHLWSLSPRSNPVTEWNYLPELHRVESKQDFTNLLARYRGIAKSIDTDIAHLRKGAARKLFANQESAERVLEAVNRQLDKQLLKWPLMEPTLNPPPDSQAEAKEMAHIVTTLIRPALVRYRDFLEQSILPHARSEEESGLGALPLGEACYRALIRRHTTLSLDARALHQTGLSEVERIDREMATLGKKLFGLDERKKVLSWLRSEKDLYFDNEDQVAAKAKSALARARAAIPKYFGILPKADCVVRPIPDYEAPYTTIAYYRQPTPDGSKPGEYFINTYAPRTRPRYEAEVLAFHESIPGHHLQIAIAQELPNLPEFRKHLGMTAFVEGWALYTEQLADEMGLYTSDLDRMGMLSFEAWRAARLVVDTGIHAMGWSRTRAKQFMADHTALALNNIDNEVDRYIVWPGQALAYKTGQLEIWKLRRSAEKALGARFDLRAFHDVVLKGGAVTLSVLRQQVEGWVQDELKRG